MPSISSVVGGLVETLSIANILFGITIAQFYMYTKSWDRDPRWMKCLAICIIFLETAYTGLSQEVQYFYSVLTIDEPLRITMIDKTVPATLFLMILAEWIVQGFYLYRIWIFSRNILLPAVLIFLLICRHGLMINCLVDTIKMDTWQSLQILRGFTASFTTAMATIIFTDAIIAALMVYFLHRRQTRIRRTRGIISWLILYFVSTGGILVAISSASLISYLANGETFLWGGFVLLYARALAVSFYGILNARQQLRTKRGEIVTFGGISIQRETLPTSVELHKIHDKTDSNAPTTATTNVNSDIHEFKSKSVSTLGPADPA
ncbi:hypothetical protein QCA50_014144 [Cerrena zonata]|uniref:DUF6534 domain-containing protein n=1 Tax=Cerrena zonata TaxID=2478898 RepID=A0AAW0FPT4_9APHY